MLSNLGFLIQQNLIKKKGQDDPQTGIGPLEQSFLCKLRFFSAQKVEMLYVS